jgi:bile acid:Na+ symporter, BASS family
MAIIESLYAVLLVVALVLNGVALAGATPLGRFFEPLREGRLILGIVVLDVVVVPVVAVGLATLLDLDVVTRAALVIVAAASAGPIGIALSRIGRGDVPLAVTTVLGLGALNLFTVPLVTGLLLPDSVPLPPVTIATSLIGLVIVPLLAGRVFAAVVGRARVDAQRSGRWLAVIGRIADLCLFAAISVAVFLDPRETVEVLAGPVSLIAVAVMLIVTVGARLLTDDPDRVRTIAITINARAVGLALTLTALYLGDVPGLRSTVLAYGGLTQLIPILLVLILNRRSRRDTAVQP